MKVVPVNFDETSGATVGPYVVNVTLATYDFTGTVFTLSTYRNEVLLHTAVLPHTPGDVGTTTFDLIIEDEKTKGWFGAVRYHVSAELSDNSKIPILGGIMTFGRGIL